MSQDLGLAVFTGLHAVRAVTQDGQARWEIGHACWACESNHESAEEYAGDRYHRYSDHGSAGFNAGNRAVWAHVRVPLVDDDDKDAGQDPRGESSREAWLVIRVADGSVLARADTETYAAGSHHVPHPDPAVMGLSVGEGQDGSPATWGRRQDDELKIDRLAGDDRVLVAIGPGGRTFLTVGHGQRQELTVHRRSDHAVLGTLFADALAPTDASARWDFRYGLVDDRTFVASTSDRGHGETGVRHWLIDLIDVESLDVRGPVRYPGEVASNPVGLGDGTWLTKGPNQRDVSVWRLP